MEKGAGRFIFRAIFGRYNIIWIELWILNRHRALRARHLDKVPRFLLREMLSTRSLGVVPYTTTCTTSRAAATGISIRVYDG